MSVAECLLPSRFEGPGLIPNTAKQNNPPSHPTSSWACRCGHCRFAQAGQDVLLRASYGYWPVTVAGVDGELPLLQKLGRALSSRMPQEI